MSNATLQIDLDAITANWRALNAAASGKAGAVIKADAYGLGAAKVAPALAKAGARTFFVALASEGVALRATLGRGPKIYVFNGYSPDARGYFTNHSLTPLLNSPEQFARFHTDCPNAPFGLQFDSGMNRLGMEPDDVAALDRATSPDLIISHLACADEPTHPMNAQQLAQFRSMTADWAAPKSLSATGGTLLGAPFHFDMVRPGIGLYGGLPFSDATPVVTLSVPVIQTREVQSGETVGYGNSWTASRPSKIATLALGYADGMHRVLSKGVNFYARSTPCPSAGRISMDLITVDVTDLDHAPQSLDLICEHQTIDDLAQKASTIGYEVLTSLGSRFARVYKGG